MPKPVIPTEPQASGGILFLLWKSRGNSTFSKVVKLQGKGVLALKYSCLVQTPCAKTAKSCAFCDSLPVLALECFSAFETGFFFPNSAPLNSGLWLTAFDKSEFFRCQSAPGPPMLCFLICNRQSVSEFSVS